MAVALADAPAGRNPGEPFPSSTGDDKLQRGAREGWRSALDVLAAAVWAGLVTGLAEASYWLVRQHLFDELVWLHPSQWWMSPAFLIAVMAIPGSVLSLLAWRKPCWEVLPFAVTVFALVGWLNMLLLAPLHFWAWILAACGLATATGRVFLARRSLCLRTIRCTTAPLVGVLLLAVAGQSVWQKAREAATIAALPAAPADAPNILVIVLDAVRADALELYGHDREVAPHLTALAETGATFDQAWSTAPWTLPSHAGLFTGRLPGELSADWLSPLDDSAPTLAESLANRGWVTGGFVGNTRYCSAETGLARGFLHYEDYPQTLEHFALCTAIGRKCLFGQLPVHLGATDFPGRKPAAAVSRGLMDWLPRRGSRPYFAFVNFYDAHDPYVAPPGYATSPPVTHEQRLLMRHWWSLPKGSLSAAEIEWLRKNYEDCIRGLDAHVGQLLAELRRRGQLENTIVVVTSDHGEHFGDHDLFLHGNSLYEPLIHVPLVVAWPDRIPAGRRVSTPVSLRGLPNTILELTGDAPTFAGRSWTAHLTSGPPRGPAREAMATEAAAPEATATEILMAELASQAGHPPCHGHSPVARGPMQCLRQGNLKYIRNGDGTEELYDLASDPPERRNLAGNPDHRTALARLRRHWQEQHQRRDSEKGE